MSKDITEIKGRQNYEWIRGESGASYLCPRDLLDKKDVTEAQLKASCVDESLNPHND